MSELNERLKNEDMKKKIRFIKRNLLEHESLYSYLDELEFDDDDYTVKDFLLELVDVGGIKENTLLALMEYRGLFNGLFDEALENIKQSIQDLFDEDDPCGLHEDPEEHKLYALAYRLKELAKLKTQDVQYKN